MGLAAQSVSYRPRAPEKSIVHRMVRDHLEEFLLEVATKYENGVPDFVEDELRRFIGCGHLAAGFVRIKCEKCGHERLLPFACKRRAVCSSCAGRRMAERAAHLVDSVFPVLPVRQWVLSLPFALRYKMAWDHALELRVLRQFWRAVEQYYQLKAKARGLSSARVGAVTVIQRAGGAINLNPHFHSAVVDGVFVEEDEGAIKFHRLPAPSTEEVAAVVKEVRKRVLQMLGAESFTFEEEDAWSELAEESPAMAAASMASIYQLVAFGKRAGGRVMRVVDAPRGQNAHQAQVESRRKRHARYQGFDLHVGAAVPGQDRQRLERLLRYLLRPPIAESRLKELPSGKILLKLKNHWQDGGARRQVQIQKEGRGLRPAQGGG
jgi:ribosomal protein S27E